MVRSTWWGSTTAVICAASNTQICRIGYSTGVLLLHTHHWSAKSGLILLDCLRAITWDGTCVGRNYRGGSVGGVLVDRWCKTGFSAVLREVGMLTLIVWVRYLLILILIVPILLSGTHISTSTTTSFIDHGKLLLITLHHVYLIIAHRWWLLLSWLLLLWLLVVLIHVVPSTHATITVAVIHVTATLHLISCLLACICCCWCCCSNETKLDSAVV